MQVVDVEFHQLHGQAGFNCPAAAAACQALILDEAHRLKSRTSATRAALLELPVHWWLLLSGTPVQNNMRELQVGAACTLQLLPLVIGLLPHLNSCMHPAAWALCTFPTHRQL
jgi:hypothetical protein